MEANKHLVAAIFYHKRYDAVLKETYGCSEESFHKNINILRRKLPRNLIRHLSTFNFIRNQLVHDSGTNALSDPESFVQSINFIEDQLAQLIPDFEKEKLTLDDLQLESSSQTYTLIKQPERPPVTYWERALSRKSVTTLQVFIVLFVISLFGGLIGGLLAGELKQGFSYEDEVEGMTVVEYRTIFRPWPLPKKKKEVVTKTKVERATFWSNTLVLALIGAGVSFGWMKVEDEIFKRQLLPENGV